MLWTDCVWFCDVPPSSTTDSPSPWREGRENLLDELDELTLQGWMLHDKSLYRVSTTKKGWRASREDCQKRKADLVVINSREELLETTLEQRDDRRSKRLCRSMGGRLVLKNRVTDCTTGSVRRA
ncbi:unnamed protein product [Arctogadus glacialis]